MGRTRLTRAQRRGMPLATARKRSRYTQRFTRLLDELFLPAPAPTPKGRKRRLSSPHQRPVRRRSYGSGSQPDMLSTDATEAVRLRVEQDARGRASQPHKRGRPRAHRAHHRASDRRPTTRKRSTAAEAELSEPQLAALARALRDDLIGLGAIAERMLSDPDAQEWMVNGPKRVFRDNGERIERVPDIAFADDRQVRAFLERLLEQVEGKRLDRITPRIEARLPDGSRLTAAIPPVSSNGHPICSIRRFRLGAGSLARARRARLPERAGRRLPRRLRPRRARTSSSPAASRPGRRRS